MIKASALYTGSRTIHRVFVVVMLTCTVIMGGTGGLLKYPGIAEWLSMDQGMIRAVHSSISTWFLIILSGMALTGTYMYVYPWYLRYKTRKELHQQSSVAKPDYESSNSGKPMA